MPKYSIDYIITISNKSNCHNDETFIAISKITNYISFIFPTDKISNLCFYRNFCYQIFDNLFIKLYFIFSAPWSRA